MAEFDGENGDIEVVIDDDDRGRGRSAGGDGDRDSDRGGGRDTGSRPTLDERLERLNARDRGGDADAAATLRDELTRTQRFVAQFAGRQERLETALLTDVAARDRARLVAEAEHRIQGLQDQKRQALDEGDTATAVRIDTQIMEAIGEKRALRHSGGQGNAGPASQDPAPTRRQAPPADDPPAAPEDPLLRDFQSRNKWFGSDPARSQYAMEVHERIKRSAPKSVGSREYYDTIEEAVTDKFGRASSGGQPPLSTSSPRNSDRGGSGGFRRDGRGRETIRLTREQVEIAGKMGMKPEHYARGIKMAMERGLPNPVDFARSGAARW